MNDFFLRLMAIMALLMVPLLIFSLFGLAYGVRYVGKPGHPRAKVLAIVSLLGFIFAILLAVWIVSFWD